jgi:hypothetical protein
LILTLAGFTIDSHLIVMLNSLIYNFRQSFEVTNLLIFLRSLTNLTLAVSIIVLIVAVARMSRTRQPTFSQGFQMAIIGGLVVALIISLVVSVILIVQLAPGFNESDFTSRASRNAIPYVIISSAAIMAACGLFIFFIVKKRT